MSCVAIERLAAAASGEDAAAAAHAAACVRCSVLLGEQRDVVAAAHALRAPAIDHAHRAELAAELAARLDDAGAWRAAAAFDEESPRSWKPYAIGAVLAVAAAIALVFAWQRDAHEIVATTPVIAMPIAPVATAVVEVPVVHVVSPIAPTVPPPHREKPRVIAAHPPIVPIAPTEEAPPVAHAAPAADSMAAFRAGWQALRSGRNADAIAAFDRATDPVVVEDATFWAAIAADRAGDREESKRRLHDFLEQYPQSPHVDAARAALSSR